MKLRIETQTMSNFGCKLIMNEQKTLVSCLRHELQMSSKLRLWRFKTVFARLQPIYLEKMYEHSMKYNPDLNQNVKGNF